MHDNGKIGVPDNIFKKPERLTDEEFATIKTHTSIGAKILSNLSSLPNAQFTAKHHHERYDGKGYPDGLKGEDIPLNARIVAVADAYDAMNSNHVYRKALSKDIIMSELIKGRGTQFDPNLLDIFVKLLEGKENE